ncbi:hypothetical protein [Flavobacterium daemonense]|uniref:hypothetical protein n=1 Tax=Flavobacterium daemonense TaxID=1393049 RepID=UPI001184F80F|nr:hypothetical protein [Flavobacterium daemonense]KAF2337202.1 hypothetical protein FND99_01970 [Flavobacterium daemonense]
MSEKKGLINELIRESYKPDFLYRNGAYEREQKVREIYTDFVLNFLMQHRSGKGKIDNLVLRKNSIPDNVFNFFSKEYSIEIGYVDVIKRTDKYYILKINERGKSRYHLTSVKYKIKVPTDFTRLGIFLIKVLKIVSKFLFDILPKAIKKFLDSAIVKLILFLIPLITLALKWDEIIKFIHRITK